MTFDFCPACGQRLHLESIGDEGQTPYCGRCKRPFFGYSHPCVIVMIFDDLGRIMLIRQSYGHGRHVLVAGYIKQGETAECTVAREALEEVGLVVEDITFVKSYYHDTGDNLMLGFCCRAAGGSEPVLSGEVAWAGWHTPAQAMDKLRHGSIAWQLLAEYTERRAGA